MAIQVDLNKFNEYDKMFSLQNQATQPTPQTKKGAANYISEAGGLVGGLLGSIAGPVGSVAGASLGALGGQALENKITGKKEGIVKEALLSGGGQLLGGMVGKGLAGLAGKTLEKGAVSTIAKAYKPAVTAVRKTVFNNADDFAQYVVKNNKNLSDDAISALQSQYDKAVTKSGIKFDPNKLISNLMKEAKKKSTKEAATSSKEFAKQLQREAENLKQLFGNKKTANLADLVQQRKYYDTNVTKFGGDDLKDINLAMRNRLKDAINKYADKAKVKVNGQSVKDTGVELSKRYGARQLIEAGLEKGNIRSILNIPALGLAAGGGGTGGIPGAALGVLAGNALTNPAVLGGIAGGASKLGGSLIKNAPKIGTAAGLLQQITNKAGSQVLTPQDTMQTTDQTQMMQPAQQTQTTQVAETPETDQNRQYFEKALANDMATTGGKNIDKILKIAEFMGVDTTGKTKAVKAPTAMQAQVGGYANRLAAANQIFDQLEPSIGTKLTSRFSIDRNIPDRLKSEDMKLQEQAERNFINAVLRRESGAAIAPSEFESAKLQYFPQAGDSPAVLAQKRQNRLLVQQNFVNESSGQQTSNADIVSQLLQQIGQ